MSGKSPIKDKKCQYCKKLFTKLTREHVIPSSKGGCNHRHNIILVCVDCNSKRGNTPMYQFLSDNRSFVMQDIAIKVLKAVDCYINECQSLKAKNNYLVIKNGQLGNKIGRLKNSK